MSILIWGFAYGPNYYEKIVNWHEVGIYRSLVRLFPLTNKCTKMQAVIMLLILVILYNMVFLCCRANQSSSLNLEAVHVATDQERRWKWAYRQSGGAALLSTDPSSEVTLSRTEAENPHRGTFAKLGREWEVGVSIGGQQLRRQRHHIELNELGYAVPKGE